MTVGKGNNKGTINRSILHAGHRLRLRDRARREGLDKFTEHQFLEFVLSFVIARKDTNDLAHLILNKFGSLEAILNTPYEMLAKFEGLGEVSATFLSMLNNMIAYIDKSKKKEPTKIKSTTDVHDTVVPLLSKAEREKFVILFIDGDDNRVHIESTNIGFLDKISIDTEEIRTLVRHFNAKKIVMAHNQINSVLYPSQSDIDFTKKAYAMLYFMGADLADHVIVSNSGDIYSFRSAHHLDQYRQEVMKYLNQFEAQWVGKE